MSELILPCPRPLLASDRPAPLLSSLLSHAVELPLPTPPPQATVPAKVEDAPAPAAKPEAKAGGKVPKWFKAGSESTSRVPLFFPTHCLQDKSTCLTLLLRNVLILQKSKGQTSARTLPLCPNPVRRNTPFRYEQRTFDDNDSSRL